jgi:hypothetical protein
MSVMSGETEQDKETREGRIGASRIPFSDISLEVQTPWGALNAGRLIGPQAFNQPGDNSLAGDVSDFGPIAFPKKSNKTGNWYGFNDPVLGPLASLLTDTDFRGKPISDPNSNKYTGSLATSEQKAENRLKYLGESFSPPGTDDINRVIQSFKGEKDSYGPTFTPKQSIARVFGLKVEEYGPEQAQAQREKDMSYKLNAVDGLQKDISTIYNQLSDGKINEQTALEQVSAKQAELDKLKTEINGTQYNAGQENLSPEKASILDKSEKKRIQTFLENGIDVSDQDLLNYYGGDLSTMPESTATEKMKKQEVAFKIVDDVLGSDLDEDKKGLILNNLGIEPADAQYYLDAKESQQVKFTQITSVLDGMENADDALVTLLSFMKEVNGQAILTSGIITDLYESGYISKAMKTELGKYRYNPVTGQVEKKRSASEGEKPKKFSVDIPNISTPKMNLPEIKMGSSKNSNLIRLSTDMPKIEVPEALKPTRVSTRATGASNESLTPRLRTPVRSLSGLGRG